MSFSYNKVHATKEDALAHLKEDASVPEPIKDYLRTGINAYPDNKTISVVAYGHSRAPLGDGNRHTANIAVEEAPAARVMETKD